MQMIHPVLLFPPSFVSLFQPLPHQVEKVEKMGLKKQKVETD